VDQVSKLEEHFSLQLQARHITGWEREYSFHDKRRWRFDFAWPDLMLAVEIEGGTWSGGRHTRGAGFRKDAEKYNTATIGGWRVLKGDASMVRDCTLIEHLVAALVEAACTDD
jgi:hypothetical protein